MNIYLGSDHGGFVLKAQIMELLQEKGCNVIDVGCDSGESCDYPVFGAEVARRVVADMGSLGIVVCGSGIGISIAANKVPGARCALCPSVEMARLARQHNGAQILALGERTQTLDPSLKIVKAFLDTEIDTAERHQRRRELLDQITDC